MVNSDVTVLLKRRVQIQCLFIVAVFALCASRSAHAQSYSTYTVDGIASSIDGQWYIGTDGSFNALTVNNAGWLSVNGGTTIGYQAGANRNSALVTDTGSVWDNQGDLVVGDAGSRNRLTVANGGMVNNYNGWIGGNGGQQVQSLLQLANTDNAAGLQQSVQRLSSGQRINSAADDAAGLSLNAGNNNTGLNSTANNNSVRVTGAGSTWNNNGDLVVGYSGAGNKLTIANGGAVNNNNGWIGGNGNLQQSSSILQQANVAQQSVLQLLRGDDASSLQQSADSLSSGSQINSGGDNAATPSTANNNSVRVTGAGSAWNNNGDLVVGATGAGNKLTVANGGVVNNNNGWIGGSAVQQAQSVLQLLRGDDASSLQQSDSLSSGSQINSGSDNAAGLTPSTANNNAVRVTGAGSTWNNNGDLVVGYSGAGNKLTIANGGVVNNNNGWIGGSAVQQSQLSQANQSVLRLFGDNQPASSDDAAGLSLQQSSNRLSSGSRINSAGDDAAGLSLNSTANNNAVLVTGAGSVWNNNGNVTVGTAGSGNTLTVANGGAVNVSGDLSVRNGNQVLATGGDLNVGGRFNNAGTVTQLNSQGTFTSAVNAGTWQTAGGVNNSFGGAGLINTGVIKMQAGDVFTFSNTQDGLLADFVNLGANSSAYDTTRGEFVFQGGANQIQSFATAGLDLGAGLTPDQKYTADMFGAGNSANNFGLGVLDLAPDTTLEITDAHPLDGQRAALYLNDLELNSGAKLIVDPNVTVYYYGSQGFNSANVTLLGDGAFYQLTTTPLAVPEPSSLVLLGLGGLAIVIVRLWKRKEQHAISHA